MGGFQVSTASNGRAREHRVRDHLIAKDWLLVARSAGSKGPCDLVMVHPFFGVALVQVGTAKSKRLNPDERAKFVALAEACSALPLVALCSPGIPPRFLVATRDVPGKWRAWEH